MTEPLANTVTPEEAAEIRAIAAGGDPTVATVEADEHHRRIWNPIEAAAPARSARCRLCSGPIEKGEQAIRFSFDPYGEGSWGRLSSAYLHTVCPGEKETR